MSIIIAPLARSVYHQVKDERYRSTFDQIAGELSANGNWFARKRILMESLMALEIGIFRESRKVFGQTGTPRADLVRVVPSFIGGILEKLAEPTLDSVEQAAFYTLSYHQEHQVAADQWLKAEPRRAKAFKKFIKANRFYRDLLNDGIRYGDR